MSSAWPEESAREGPNPALPALSTHAAGVHPPSAARTPLERSADKSTATAIATAALQGIEAVPSRDDRGRHTLILRRGPWVREILPEHLSEALNEARILQKALEGRP